MGDEPAKFLRWATPFEGPMSDLFVVRDADGERMRYIGANAHRKPVREITEQDFVTLNVWETKSIVIDIAGQYEFTHDGTYYIRVNNPTDAHITYHDLMKTLTPIEIVGTTAQKKIALQAETLRLTQRAERLSFIQGKTGMKSVTFKDNCDAAQQAAIRKWSTEARRWIEKAAVCDAVESSYLCGQNVAIWFNPKSDDKFAASVQDTLKNMLKHWEDSDWDCDPPQCAEGVFAYVYPTQRSQTVQICPFTFTYHVETEKIQTIIHELSHFDHIGVNEMHGYQQGERDMAYGETKCKALAQAAPVQAMNNADNVGYFARDIGLDVDPNCSDELSECSDWAAAGHCARSLSDGRALSQVCKQSCATCTKPSPTTTRRRRSQAGDYGGYGYGSLHNGSSRMSPGFRWAIIASFLTLFFRQCY